MSHIAYCEHTFAGIQTCEITRIACMYSCETPSTNKSTGNGQTPSTNKSTALSG